MLRATWVLPGKAGLRPISCPPSSTSSDDTGTCGFQETKLSALSPCICSFFLEFYFMYFLYSKFLLIIYFIHTSVYTSIPIPNSSHHHHSPPLSPVGVHTFFSLHLSLFLPCKLVHLYHFSRFHIHVLIYNICFSLSDLLHSV